MARPDAPGATATDAGAVANVSAGTDVAIADARGAEGSARGEAGVWLPAVAAAVCAVLVGAAIVATRSVVDQLGPASIAFLRYLVGFCCLVPPLLLAGRVRIARGDLLPICLLGIGQFGLLIFLLNYGLRTVPSARGALLFATTPLLTMLLAAALRLEGLSPAKVGGVLLTFVGVALALGERVLEGGGWVGEAAVIGSALCGAACALGYRPYLRRYPTLPVSALAMLAADVFLALLAAGEGLFGAPPRLALAGWGAVLFIGLASGVGYYLWLWALGHAPATRVTVFLSLSPITSALLGAVLLSEPVSTGLLVGLIAVVLGLVLAHDQLHFHRFRKEQLG